MTPPTTDGAACRCQIERESIELDPPARPAVARLVVHEAKLSGVA
jgi:hypothetical protein